MGMFKGEHQTPGSVLHRVWPFQEPVEIRTRNDVIPAVREVERTNSLVCQLKNQLINQ